MPHDIFHYSRDKRMTDTTLRFTMRCRKCKNTVPYMIDDDDPYYKSVNAALAKNHNFAFKDYCGCCNAEQSFGVVYPAMKGCKKMKIKEFAKLLDRYGKVEKALVSYRDKIEMLRDADSYSAAEFGIKRLFIYGVEIIVDENVIEPVLIYRQCKKCGARSWKNDRCAYCGAGRCLSV